MQAHANMLTHEGCELLGPWEQQPYVTLPRKLHEVCAQALHSTRALCERELVGMYCVLEGIIGGSASSVAVLHVSQGRWLKRCVRQWTCIISAMYELLGMHRELTDNHEGWYIA